MRSCLLSPFTSLKYSFKLRSLVHFISGLTFLTLLEPLSLPRRLDIIQYSALPHRNGIHKHQPHLNIQHTLDWPPPPLGRAHCTTPARPSPTSMALSKVPTTIIHSLLANAPPSLNLWSYANGLLRALGLEVVAESYLALAILG